MRLIRTDESKEIVEFQAAPYPPYVALSHTWGKVGDEVTFQEMTHCREEAVKKPGFAKIDQCCKRAREDQFKYVWIDTCCIDKTSSAELSEAINSMYSWYQGARICYAYLEDVPTASDVVSEFEEAPFDEKQQFQNSRWFTRGWTLQELIAPGIVEFYAADWTEIGTKISLLNVLVAITGIDNGALAGQPLQSYTVAARLSWAGSRRTTRPEDRAYCLLGIFSVNMPMIYGEGDRAFLRLQEEIMKGAEDYTMFAWGLILPFKGATPTKSAKSMHMSLEEAKRQLHMRGGEYHRATLSGPLATSPAQFAVGKRKGHGPNTVSYSDFKADWNLLKQAEASLDNGPPLSTSRGLAG